MNFGFWQLFMPFHMHVFIFLIITQGLCQLFYVDFKFNVLNSMMYMVLYIQYICYNRYYT